MKNKIYTYHRALSFVDIETEKKYSVATQLYKVGVYAIFNNDSSEQYNLEPKDMVKMEKALLKDITAGKIKDLELKSPIQVHKVDGLWEEVSKFNK